MGIVAVFASFYIKEQFEIKIKNIFIILLNVYMTINENPAGQTYTTNILE